MKRELMRIEESGLRRIASLPTLSKSQPYRKKEKGTKYKSVWLAQILICALIFATLTVVFSPVVHIF